MEKRYEHPSGLAAAITGTLLYILCSVIVIVWPTQSIQLLATWFHGIDLTKIAIEPQITIGSFLVGLLGVFIAMYILGFVYAWTYNLCTIHCKNKKWIK